MTRIIKAHIIIAHIISTWFPRPRLSASLLAIWLLLNQSLAPGQFVMGAILAILIARLTARVWPTPIRLRRPDLALRYLGRLLWDIVIANLEVTRLIMTRPVESLHPRFIELPLEVQDDLVVALLAATITLTPGTIAVDVTPDRRRLLIHCLDAKDESGRIAVLKTRYEALLREMFAEC